MPAMSEPAHTAEGSAGRDRAGSEQGVLLGSETPGPDYVKQEGAQAA